MKIHAESKKWMNLPDAPIVFTEFMAVCCADSIYVMNGSKMQGFYHLDLSHNKWHKDPDMIFTTRWLSATCDDVSIYVIENKHGRRFQSFTIKKNTWELLKCELPEGLPYHLGVSLVNQGNSVYALGGDNTICCQYSKIANNWTVLKSNSSVHSFGSALFCGDKIYLCGGYAVSSDEIEVYDLGTEGWSTSDVKLPQKLCWFTIAKVSFL